MFVMSAFSASAFGTATFFGIRYVLTKLFGSFCENEKLFENLSQPANLCVLLSKLLGTGGAWWLIGHAGKIT